MVFLAQWSLLGSWSVAFYSGAHLIFLLALLLPHFLSFIFYFLRERRKMTQKRKQHKQGKIIGTCQSHTRATFNPHIVLQTFFVIIITIFFTVPIILLTYIDLIWKEPDATLNPLSSINRQKFRVLKSGGCLSVPIWGCLVHFEFSVALLGLSPGCLSVPSWGGLIWFEFSIASVVPVPFLYSVGVGVDVGTGVGVLDVDVPKKKKNTQNLYHTILC